MNRVFTTVAPGWLGVYAGNVNTAGNLNNVGTNGRYWSSSVNSATNAYNLYIDGTNVNPANNNNKANGISVRCVR